MPFSKNLIIIASILFFTLGVFIIVEAAFNSQINYQGKLTDENDILVPDDDYNMEFKLWSDETSTSSSYLEWTETCTSTDKITVTNGLFSHLLGTVNSLSSIDFNQTLWLGVNIGGTSTDPVWDGEMTPRKKLGAVPAAFEADKLDGIDSSQFLRSDVPDTMATSSASTVLTVTQNGSGDLVHFITSATTRFKIDAAGNITLTGEVTIDGHTTTTGNVYIGGDITATTYYSTSTDSTIRKSGEEVFRGEISVFPYNLPIQTGTTTYFRVSEVLQGDLFDSKPQLLPGATRVYRFDIKYADDLAAEQSSEWRIYKPSTASTTDTFTLPYANTSSLGRGKSYITELINIPDGDWQLDLKLPVGGKKIRIFEILLVAYDQI